MSTGSTEELDLATAVPVDLYSYEYMHMYDSTTAVRVILHVNLASYTTSTAVVV
eukprot:COSAG01_NODE_17799_length_1123_cov_1.186523_1_plen_54_part_00